MTEAEWLAGADPSPMLEFLRGKASDRKLRLFSCECCRRVGHLMRDEQLKSALDALERYADGGAGDRQRLEAGRASSSFQRRHWEDPGREEEVCIATELWNASTKRMHRVIATCGGSAAAAFAWVKVGDFKNRTRDERAEQSALLRDILGNPVRPVTLSPSWLTSPVLALASAMYESRAFAPMPILADALEEAGCDNPDVLAHCRGPGPHVRGCWVVDLILGKG